MGLIQNKVTVSQPTAHIVVKDAGGLRGLTGPQGEKGEQGNPGTAATVNVGSTTTLPAGSNATVQNVGSIYAATLNFGIPKGDKGDTGDSGAAATISVGSTSTLPAGSSATVTNSGTSSAAVFNFGIPKGEKGAQGDQGVPGADGFSPTATVSKTGDTATITITDKDGTTTAQISDGVTPTIDDALSPTSENPVQNKVVANALAGKQPSFEIVEELPATGVEGSEYLVDKTYEIITQLQGDTEQTTSPVPSPDYPQEVQIVTGEQTITVSNGQGESQEYEVNLGKNLCDGINQEYWLTSAATGAGVSSGNSGLIIPVAQNTQYTISTTVSQTRYRIAFSDQVWGGSQFNCYNGANKDGTSDSITKNSGNHKYLIVNATDLTKIQVEKGSSATTYAEYFAPIELCKIGEYQDYIYKSGNDWYLHKETAEMILDGAETITKPFTNIFVVENLSGDWPKESEAVFYYCKDYYRLKTTGSNSNFDTLAADYSYAFNFTSSASGRNIRFKDTRYDNVDDYKTWLATNNVTVYYALAIPTDRQVLEPALIAQLEALNAGQIKSTDTITIKSNCLPTSLILAQGANSHLEPYVYYNGKFEKVQIV